MKHFKILFIVFFFYLFISYWRMWVSKIPGLTLATQMAGWKSRKMMPTNQLSCFYKILVTHSILCLLC